MSGLEVLDLFSAAAGGWSLGMHRAGFRTIAACESVAWRRELYAVNNPDVRIYDDVRTLTADQLVRDLGRLPSVVVGSPPCQDISPANTKGQGVDGERSGLFFEAVRLVGEIRPRWVALENSHNLRTRGADRVLSALEDLNYACWPLVVRARNVGANHERPRCWIVAFSDTSENGCGSGRQGRRPRAIEGLPVEACGDADASRLGHVGWRPWRHGADGDGASPIGPGHICPHGIRWPWACYDCDRDVACPPSVGSASRTRSDVTFTEHEGAAQPNANGQGEPDGTFDAEMGGCPSAGGAVAEPWADWNGGLAHHLRLDDGLSAWVAGTRVAVGGPRGTSAAALIVEAFGDAVLPQIPEAIGRAILRTEAALSAVYGAAA